MSFRATPNRFWRIALLSLLLLFTPLYAANTTALKPTQLISLNFSDIQVRQLLEILSQFSGRNFVINDNVKGVMTIHLKNVSWQDALQVVLESQGLGKLAVGNSYIIAPLAQITEKKISQLQNANKLASEAPLINRIIFLKYANASDLYKMLTSGTKPLLSGRGTVNINQRTNSIWIQDTAQAVARIVPLIRKLDYPLKQVQIDARIVSVNKDYERNLGVRLGITNPYSVSGTLAGANALQTANSGGQRKNIADTLVTVPNAPTTINGDTTNLIPYTDRLNFNNAAAGTLFSSASAFTPGSFGLALAKLAGNNLLDLELSALEGEQKLHVLSSPKIITVNQRKAVILQGSEVPYAVTSAGGGTSIQLEEATLRLEVTPQITPDNRVILSISVSNNSQGNTVSTGGSSQAVSLSQEEESSTVLLKDNQTVVIGGIYKQTKGKTVVRIPFLWRIPLLGKLFTSTQNKSYNNELLFFITPHIIKRPEDITTGFKAHA